jgi:D-lactate dehydrogenase
MTSIHFFDVNQHDATLLKDIIAKDLPGAQATFHQELASPHPDAMVISPFVSSKVTAEMIAAMPKLKLIACRSTGYDNIDLAAAAEHGITVCNVPSYGENTVAEYAFGLLLALTRKIPQAIAQLQAGNTSHDQLQGIDLAGKTLGILGAGRIGCRMAQIANGFGMKVITYDTRPNPARAEQYHFRYEPLDTVLRTADILSLHLPNLPETKHLLSAAALTKLKPGAILVNTSRGEVVETGALIEALTTNRLSGAALDVFEGENNLGPSTLQKLPNVVLTNHNAFNTAEAVARIHQTTIQNIAAFLKGEPQNEVKAS